MPRPSFLFLLACLLVSRVQAQDKTIFLAPEGETISGTNAAPEKSSGFVPPDISKMSDDEFLDMVEKDSIMFYVDCVNAKTGLITEDRSLSHVGSNGFGLMALCAGAERGWLSREDAAARVLKILDTFLNKGAHFKGSLRWITDADTAQGGAFGNGFDIVETAYVCAGALVCKQYFDGDLDGEKKIREYADKLYRRVEWDAYLYDAKGKKTDSLAWGYDADKQAFGELHVGGYNECMITYIMALGSPTHPVPAKSWEAWTRGYAWKKVYGYDYFFCPALFTHQYSLAWLELRDVQDKPTRDKGITYFENSRRAALSHIAYAKQNPEKMPGYGPIWGLTDCGCPLHDSGFGGHGLPPTSYDLPDDDGTIAISAAGGSMPFVPDESIAFLRLVYRRYGDKIYDQHGFRNAFNVKTGWVDNRHDALNKAAMICMIENHRSGLFWKLFMANPEIKTALKKAGFEPLKKVEAPKKAKGKGAL
jgi:hypothetical protein